MQPPISCHGPSFPDWRSEGNGEWFQDLSALTSAGWYGHPRLLDEGGKRKSFSTRAAPSFRKLLRPCRQLVSYASSPRNARSSISRGKQVPADLGGSDHLVFHLRFGKSGNRSCGFSAAS